MPWIRLEDSTFDNPKIAALPALAQLKWVHMLCLAKKHDGEIRLTTSQLACAWRCSTKKTEEILKLLADSGLVEISKSGVMRMHDWDDYQVADSAERMRKYRNKGKFEQNVAPSDAQVTHSDAQVTHGDAQGSVTRDAHVTPTIQYIDNICAHARETTPDGVLEDMLTAHPRASSRPLSGQCLCAAINEGGTLETIARNHAAFVEEWLGWDSYNQQFIPTLQKWLSEGSWRDPPKPGDRRPRKAAAKAPEGEYAPPKGGYANVGQK